MKRFLTSRWGMLLAIFTFAAVGLLSGKSGLLMAPLVFGTVSGTPGSIDYTYPDGTGNIPVKFATKALIKFYDRAIASNITRNDFIGELSKAGDTVVVPTIPTITTSRHYVNQEHDWDIPSSDPIIVKVDRARRIAFRQDKINLRQFQDKAFMEKCTDDGSKNMAVDIDTEFLAAVYPNANATNKGATAGAKTASYNLGATGAPVTVTKANVLDYFVDCGTVLDEAKIPREGRWFVIPPWMTGMLKKSDLKDASMTGQTSALVSGRLGKFDDWELFDSNLYTGVTDGADTCWPLIFGHQSAIVFASDIIENAFFEKFERFSGQGMRVVQLYDWKEVKDDAFGVLYCKRG